MGQQLIEVKLYDTTPLFFTTPLETIIGAGGPTRANWVHAIIGADLKLVWGAARGCCHVRMLRCPNADTSCKCRRFHRTWRTCAWPNSREKREKMARPFQPMRAGQHLEGDRGHVTVTFSILHSTLAVQQCNSKVQCNFADSATNYARCEATLLRLISVIAA